MINQNTLNTYSENLTIEPCNKEPHFIIKFQEDNNLKIDEQKQLQIPQQEQQNNDNNSQAQKQYHKSSLKIYLYVVIMCMGGFFVGYNIAVLNLSANKLYEVYGIKDKDEQNLKIGILTSSFFFGGILGSMLSGKFLSTFGERKTLLFSDITGIAISLLFLIPNWWIALIVRFYLGILMALNSATIPLFIREISPISISATTGSIYQLFVTVGIFIAYCLGLGFPIDAEELQDDKNEFYWRFVLIFPVITQLIRLIAFTFCYKLSSPQQYMIQNKPEIAKKVLQQIYKQEHLQTQFQNLQKDVKNQLETSDTWKQTTSKENKPRLKIGALVLSLYQLCGINAVLFYSSIIFEQVYGGDINMANIMSTILGASMILCVLFSGEFVKRFGRRTNIIVGYIFITFTLITLGTVSLITKDDLENEEISDFTSYFIIIFIFLFTISFNVGPGTVSWIYIGDILTGKSISIVNIMFYFFGSFIGVIFPIGQDKLGIYTMFYLFALFMIIGMIYLIPNLKETKGLSTKQIIDVFYPCQSEKLQLQNQQQQQPKQNSSENSNSQQVKKKYSDPQDTKIHGTQQDSQSIIAHQQSPAISS